MVGHTDHYMTIMTITPDHAAVIVFFKVIVDARVSKEPGKNTAI